MKIIAKTRNLMVVSALLLSTTAAYGDTLTDAVTEAVNNHPDVTIASKNSSAIMQEYNQAKAGFLPTVDLTLGSGHERSNNTTTRSRDARGDDEGGHRSLWRNESRLTVRQMIFDGFETSANTCQQKARHLSSKYNVEEIKETTALNAVQAYLDVLRNSDLVALAIENLANHDEYLEQIKQRSMGGRGSKADVRQAEGRAALAKANLYSAKGELRNSKAIYLQVIGKPASNLSKYSIPAKSLPVNLDTALEFALANHPAIMSAQADIIASKAALKGSKAAFYPRLDLELEAARQQNLDGQTGANNEYVAMGRIRYNLYRGGADSARKSERMERMSEAQDTLERDRRKIEETMYLAWNGMETAKNRLLPLSQHVTSSNQTKTAYKSQFDIGQRSLLDLLDSEIELYNSKVALVNGKYAVDFSIHEVLASAGNLTDSLQLMASR